MSLAGFWDLTPAELWDLLEAEEWRRQRARELSLYGSWATAWCVGRLLSKEGLPSLREVDRLFKPVSATERSKSVGKNLMAWARAMGAKVVSRSGRDLKQEAPRG